MNVVMEIKKFCNQLFLVHGSEERILADATASGPHKSVQEESSIWCKVLFLMDIPLGIMIGIQSLYNNLANTSVNMFFLAKPLQKLQSGGHRGPRFQSYGLCP